MQLRPPLLPHQTLLPPQLSHPDNVGTQKQDVGQFSLSEKYIIFNFYLFSEWHEVPPWIYFLLQEANFKTMLKQKYIKIHYWKYLQDLWWSPLCYVRHQVILLLSWESHSIPHHLKHQGWVSCMNLMRCSHYVVETHHQSLWILVQTEDWGCHRHHC